MSGEFGERDGLGPSASPKTRAFCASNVMTVPDPDFHSYTVAMAELVGLDLAPDELEPVVAQIERVAQLVEQLPRQDDDALTMAPKFRP